MSINCALARATPSCHFRGTFPAFVLVPLNQTELCPPSAARRCNNKSRPLHLYNLKAKRLKFRSRTRCSSQSTTRLHRRWLQNPRFAATVPCSLACTLHKGFCSLLVSCGLLARFVSFSSEPCLCRWTIASLMANGCCGNLRSAEHRGPEARVSRSA